MSWMEITLIVGAVLVPIVALILVLPKIKKEKSKTAEKPKAETKPAENKKSAEQSAEKPKEQKNVQPVFESSQYTADDFKDYLKERSKTTSAPAKKQQPKEADNFTLGFDDYFRPKRKPDPSLLDEINKMSPEMQAVVFAGLLNKKF